MQISVTIPSYNQGIYLPEAIESVLNQTLQVHEIVIVDDASTDDSYGIAAGFQSRYPRLIQLIRHTQNRGVAAARNTALVAASGDYLTYLDADDRFLPRKLEREAARLLGPDLPSIVYSDYYVINSDGERIDRWAGEAPLPEGDIFAPTISRQFPQRRLFRSELVNADAWRQVGFYRPDLSVYEDYEMRIRLTKSLRAGAVNEPLSEHRRHEEGLSRQPARIFVAAFEQILTHDLDLFLDLPADQIKVIKRHLDSWHAELLRRYSLELAGGPGPWLNRMQAAWQVYRQAQQFDHRLNPWYFFQLILPERLARMVRNGRGLLRRRKIK